MSKKIKLYMVGGLILAVVGVFSGMSLATAQTTSQSSVSPSCNSVTFNGFVTTNGNPTTVWFEWGTTTSLGNQTAKQIFYSDSSFSQLVTGLTEDTTYFYRAMATNTAGNAVGQTISFKTDKCTQPVPNPTVNISADQTNIQYDGSTTIRWTSTDATSCFASGGANGWSGNKAFSGSFNTGALTNSTTFFISCMNTTGSANDSVTVVVAPKPVPPPTVNLSADNSNLPYNGSTTIRWTSTDATSCFASGGINGWSGSKAFSGSFHTGALTKDTAYFISCSNSVGQASDFETITVAPQPTPNPTVNITADQINIQYNGSTTIRWTSNDATSCNASGGANGWSGNKALSGSFHTGALINTTTFFISCSNGVGQASGSVTIVVGNKPQNPPGVETRPPTIVTMQAY